MEHFELMEKIVNTFGVSYEKAKSTLEACNWDAVEAAVLLEREQNGVKSEAEAEVKAEQEIPQQEEPRGPKNSTAGYKFETPSFVKKIWDFFTLNNFVVKNSGGDVFLELPLWIVILLACAFFWALVLVLGIVYLMGYRFSFSGPQFHEKKVRNAVHNAADRVEKVVVDTTEKIKNSCAVEEEVPEAVEDVILNAEEVIEEQENKAPEQENETRE